MSHPSRSPRGLARPARRRRARSHPTLRNALAGLLCLATFGGTPTDDARQAGPPAANRQIASRQVATRQVASLQVANLQVANLQAPNPPASSAAATALAALFDPRPMMGPTVRADLRGAPLDAALVPAAPRLAPPVATLAAPDPAAAPAPGG